MSNIILPNCKRLEIRSSSVEGFGVFATDFIPKGEVLEETPFILFPRYTSLGKSIYDLLQASGFLSLKEKYVDNLRQNLKFKDPEKYYFKWMPTISVDGDSTYVVLPLGNGPIYNTSNTSNNAGWQVKEKTFVFRAERDIQKDEEIRTFYGYFVAQEGSIFNCETVLNLGIDSNNGQCKCKAIRFASIEQFEQGKQNPVYHRIGQLFGAAKDGLSITKISVLAPNLEVKGFYDVSLDIPLNVLYNKIAEAKSSPFPLIQISFEYEDQAGVKQAEALVFKK